MYLQRRKLIKTKGYVQDGLIARYNGANNIGIGHSITTTTWRNLVPGGIDLTTPQALSSSWGWGPNYFFSNERASTPAWFECIFPNAILPNLEDLTLEVVCEKTGPGFPITGGDIAVFNTTLSAPYLSVGMASETQLSFFISETSSFSPYIADAVWNSGVISSYAIILKRAINGAGMKTVYRNSFILRSDNRADGQHLYIQKSDQDFVLFGSKLFPNINECFFGKIYEVRIYNRALSTAERLQNYNQDQLYYGV